MKIDELCEYAKDNGFDSLEFEFKNLKGNKVKCKWLDAYFGFFKIYDNPGVISIQQWKELTGDVFEFKIIGNGH